MVPEYHADRGTGLAIGLQVGQIIIFRETLVVFGRSDSTRDIHIPQRHVIPQTIHGGHVTAILLQGRYIGHATIEIHATHGMSGDAAHLSYRHLILIIHRIPSALIAHRSIAMAALLQQPVGEVQIFRLTGHLIELDQGQLDLFMTRHPMPFARTEHAHHVIRHTNGHIQQFPFARSLIVSHGRFRHVPCAIHLVLVHVRPPLVQTGQRVEGVDIAIRLLGCRKLIDPFVCLFLQFGIRMVDQGISHAFQGLIHIGVIEKDT